jgi:hypothetical protein
MLITWSYGSSCLIPWDQPRNACALAMMIWLEEHVAGDEFLRQCSSLVFLYDNGSLTAG